MSKQIQWYPGHMEKSIRDFKNISKQIDVFFLLIDARAPESSLIKIFNSFIDNKKIIIIITKIDLVNKNELSKWINKYKREFRDCFSLSFLNKNLAKSKIINYLKNQNFNKLLPKFSIIGIPNVGKSTFLNILLNKKTAKVENRAGVTKSSSWYNLENKYWILDNPGVLEPKFDNKKTGIILASIGSIKLDILPLKDVVEGLFEIIKKKKLFNKNFTNDLNLLLNNKIKSDDDYKALIINYQKLIYGKLILDN